VRASHPVLAIDPNADAVTALRVMHHHGVRHLPVVRGAHCLGLVTETDLLRALTVSIMTPAPVASVCRPAPVAPRDAPLPAIAAEIAAGGLDAVLLVDGAVLTGILTSADVLAAVARP
jgi:predicted transcriptional regulator